MQSLWNSQYFDAVLVEAQQYLELTENLFIIVATVALVIALWALVKGA
ncbi:hypothetical protein V3H18_01490 [Methylocystis sp. 9N]|uniref:Uncharacterized protein n=1 Tax=Methylocystis borbori TaxID=3118750 RepID=A0ABU7XDG8_9HYPH